MTSVYYQTIGCVLVIITGLLRSSDLFFRIRVMDYLPVLQIITWEHIICSIFLSPLIVYCYSELKRVNWKDFSLLLFIGFGASAFGIMCYTRSFQYINPALAVLLLKLQPIVTILLGITILKEKSKLSFYLLSLVAIVSAYFTSFSTVSLFSGEWKKIFIGSIYAIGAAILWGSSTIWGKILLTKYSKNFIILSRYILGTIMTVTLSITITGGIGTNTILNLDNKLLYNLIYMAIVPGMLALVTFYYGLHLIKPSIAAIMELAFPLASVLIMWLYFNRPLDAVQLIAAICLLCSMIIISRQK